VPDAEKLAIFEDLKGLAPIDMAIKNDDIEAVDILVDHMIDRQENQVSREVLDGRMKQLLKMGYNMERLFKSKLCYHECLIEILPTKASNETQVMYVNNEYL
jgi:hypothetical protein